MASLDSRSEYENRMHRVLAYIDQHLEQPISLVSLAEVAHFSPFHFHRLFSAWMGETFGDYLRRRRVEVAAMRLASQPRSRVLNIALSVGFGSAEAFTRAFKIRFGCSPTAWREQEYSLRNANSNFGQANSKRSLALQAVFTEYAISLNPHKENIMNVTLIDRQPATVAYLRHLGPYGEPIGRFWQETYVPWAVMNKLGADHARYGISHDDPSITAPEQCRYDACAEVSADFMAVGSAHKTTIPGGKYAALKFKGTVEKVGEAWAALLRDWLPSSGLQLDGRPCFEYYPKGAAYDCVTGEFECEICVPVAPL
jgi:AraC family transcriptional regulator